MRSRGYFVVSLINLALVMFNPEMYAQQVQRSAFSRCHMISGLTVMGSDLFAATYDSGGVFHSTDLGTSWACVTSGSSVNDLHLFSIFASGTTLYVGGGQLYRSTDIGTTWTTLGVGGEGIYSFAGSGPNLLAGLYYHGISLSTDNGASWQSVTSGGISREGCSVKALLVDGADVYAAATAEQYAVEPGGVFRSTDNGVTWIARRTGLPTNAEILCLASCGQSLFAGIGLFSGGVYRSIDSGANWTLTSLTNVYQISSLATLGGDIFAANFFPGAIYRSSDEGATWTSASAGLPENDVVSCLTVSGEVVFAGTHYGGVYRSTDLGASWTHASEGLALSVESSVLELPAKFSLEQNYPNPFNPSTRIKYRVGGTRDGDRGAGEAGAGGSGLGTRVKLAVYDVLGREVTVLVDEGKARGTYEVAFDGSRHPSGIYFCRMRADSYMKTMKMLLIR